MTTIYGGAIAVEGVSRWVWEEPSLASGGVPEKFIRLRLGEGKADVVAREVDCEGGLILANVRDPEGRWTPIEVFHHPDCERCEYREVTATPEWSLYRKGYRRHWRPITVVGGRKWAPFDPMADRDSVPTAIGVAIPKALAVLDSSEKINDRLFTLAREALHEGGPVADLLRAARETVLDEMAAGVDERAARRRAGRWTREVVRGLVTALGDHLAVDRDMTPFRERLRRTVESTAKLPGDFYAGLTRAIAHLADEAEAYGATSWDDLDSRRSEWERDVIKEAEAEARAREAADLATPPDHR